MSTMTGGATGAIEAEVDAPGSVRVLYEGALAEAERAAAELILLCRTRAPPTRIRAVARTLALSAGRLAGFAHNLR